MKYLKKFKLFNEEVDFEAKITDEPDLKMSKEKLSTLKKNLEAYGLPTCEINNHYILFLIYKNLYG